jgi:septal ring factor EnvC (AmiA/AmiB activator)
LKRELDSVRDDEARMRADGRLTHRETERLERELNRLEEHISRLKHNERRR